MHDVEAWGRISRALDDALPVQLAATPLHRLVKGYSSVEPRPSTTQKPARHRARTPTRRPAKRILGGQGVVTGNPASMFTGLVWDIATLAAALNTTQRQAGEANQKAHYATA